jgi:hypothetical protein
MVPLSPTPALATPVWCSCVPFASRGAVEARGGDLYAAGRCVCALALYVADIF